MPAFMLCVMLGTCGLRPALAQVGVIQDTLDSAAQPPSLRTHLDDYDKEILPRVCALVNSSSKSTEDIQELESYLESENTFIRGFAGLGLLERGHISGLRAAFLNDYRQIAMFLPELQAALDMLGENRDHLWTRTDRAILGLGESAITPLLDMLGLGDERVVEYLLAQQAYEEMIETCLAGLQMETSENYWEMESYDRAVYSIIIDLSDSPTRKHYVLAFLVRRAAVLLNRTLNPAFHRRMKSHLYAYERELTPQAFRQEILKMLGDGDEDLTVGAIRICTVMDRPWIEDVKPLVYSDSDFVRAATFIYLGSTHVPAPTAASEAGIREATVFRRAVKLRLLDTAKREKAKELNTPYLHAIFRGESAVYPIRTVGEAAMCGIGDTYLHDDGYLDDGALSDDEISRVESGLIYWERRSRRVGDVWMAEDPYGLVIDARLLGKFKYLSPHNRGLFELRDGTEITVILACTKSPGTKHLTYVGPDLVGEEITVWGDLFPLARTNYLPFKDDEGRVRPEELRIQQVIEGGYPVLLLKGLSVFADGSPSVPVFPREEQAREVLRGLDELAAYQKLVIDICQYPTGMYPFWTLKVSSQEGSDTRFIDLFVVDAESGEFRTRALDCCFAVD